MESMRISELESGSDIKAKSFSESLREKELRDIEFKTHCESLQRDIASLRDDLQDLMMKSYAYASSSGVASEGVCLPRVSPRHNFCDI